jgi:hypothetical protein
MTHRRERIYPSAIYRLSAPVLPLHARSGEVECERRYGVDRSHKWRMGKPNPYEYGFVSTVIGLVLACVHATVIPTNPGRSRYDEYQCR